MAGRVLGILALAILTLRMPALTELGLAVGGLRSVRHACGRPRPPCRVGLNPGLIPGTGLGSWCGLSLQIRLLV